MVVAIASPLSEADVCDDDRGCRCLFADEIAKRSGVYLWTINVEGKERGATFIRSQRGSFSQIASLRSQ